MKKQYYILIFFLLIGFVAFSRTKKHYYNIFDMKNANCHNYQWSDASIRRKSGVKKILIDVLDEALICTPYDFGIAWRGGKRTAIQQNALYQQNTSTKWVTSKDGYIKISKHQRGEAVDFVVYIDGKVTWTEKYYKAVAEHILKVAKEKFNLDLIWGGNWKKKDLGHIELQN